MNLIEELTALQEHHGYLREEDLLALARRTRTPLYEIQGLHSFYPHFRVTPPAAIQVRACRDAVCHLRDEGRSLEALRAHCAGRDDVEFEPVSCLGRCDIAPACMVNDVPLSNEAAAACIDEPSRLPAAETPVRRAWQIDPHASADEHYGVLREWRARPDGAERSRALIERVAASDLRGMGGAGFPTGRKWEMVAAEPATPRYVVCNADESEPATFKDRALLAEVPHLVVEGILLAALAIDSHEGWIYIRHEYGPECRILQREIDRARERGVLDGFDLRVFVSPGGYILGEETAMLEALEGKRGEPRNKPPFPSVRGLHGQPTLINNVETFAQVPRVVRTGVADLKVYSVSGDVAQPSVVEAPLGVTLRELIARCGGMRDGRALLAFLPGGASTGFLPADRAEIPLDWTSLREAGSALGSAAVFVVGEGADLRALAGNLTAFFRNESCGKCVPCRIGTEKAVGLIAAGDDASLARLRELHETMSETSICGLGQAALTPILSVLDRFPDAGDSA